MLPTRSSILRVALLTATSALPSVAANLYWDTNGATAASGNAAGAWDTGTNWSTDAAGAVATVGWTNGQSAVFSAGTDGVATKIVTIAGTVATPSILLEEVGLVNLTGGSIDISGGSVFNTAVLAGTTGRSLTWTSAITGTGPLTLAVNGDSSATGNGSSTIFALTGTNDFTGNVTITSGVVGYTSIFGNAANSVILNGGGLVFNTTGAFTRNLQIGAAGGALRNYGAATSTLSGTLSGSGELRRTDGGTAILTGDGSGFTGALNLQRGTTQIGDGTQTTNLVANTSSIALGDAAAGSTLRYQLDSSFTLNAPVTFPNAASTFIWQGKDVLDTLTRTTALGTSAAVGTIRVNSGTLAAGSGADFRAANFQVASTPVSSATGELGVLAFGPGSNGVTRFFDIGQGGGAAGKVEQSGGLVTIEAGGTGFRIGHWNNGVTPGSSYNLSGGTLDASITTANIGWDGAATMSVGGGAGTATLKAAAIQLDANGDSATYNDTLTLLPNGVIEVAGNIASPGVNDRLILGGGTLKATGSGIWSAGTDLSPATTSALEIPSGVTTTLSALVTGTGNLSVTGGGTLSVTGASDFTGTFTKTGGTIAGTGIVAGSPTINGTVSPGTAAAPVGVLNFGVAGSTSTFNGDLLLNLSPTGDPGLSDLVSVYENVAFGPGAVIKPIFSATPSAATSTVMYYVGTRSGAPTLDPGLQIRGMTFATDVSVAGEVRLVASGTATPATLTWGGDGVGNNWNVNSAATWAGGQKFFQYDSVLFDDSGNNDTNITITGNVTPGAVTIDGTKGYTFAGSGSIIGSPAFTKNTTGDVTILNDNSFGAVNITNGKLIVGNGGSTGSIGDTGGITIPGGTTLEFNRAGNLTYARPATAGSSGTLVKKGTGTLTLGAGATLLPTNLIVEGGTLNVQGGGFSGNRMEGAGLVTVNPGATMILAAGFAHSFGGDNGTMTEAFTINQGTLTVNQEQYFKALTLNGATVNGTSEIRSSTTTNAWLVTGTAPTTIASGVSNVNATNWTVEDVTSSSAPDLTITGAITNTGATNKAGAGTLRASGTNTTTGAINVNAGTFQAGSDRALGFGAALGNVSVAGTTVAAGAILDIAGVTVNESVTLNNGGTLTNSNLATTGTLSNGLAGVRVTEPGSGYTAAPTIAFTGGGGTGATATAALTGATVGSITTTAAGTGFTTAPTVTVTGTGIGGAASATISQLGILGSGNQIGGAGNLSIPAVMVGSGSYSKVGAGSLTIPTGGSSLAGNISVDAGTLTVTASGNGTTSGLGADLATRVITVNGGTLAFGINNVFGSGATVVANLPALIVNQGATLTTNSYNVIGPVALNGGTMTDSRLTAPGGYQGFELKGTVTAGGTTPSLITAAGTFGHHLVGTISFDVADAASGTDLTVATKLLNSSADNGGTAAGLTKIGAGTLALNAANSYTGITTVDAGTLSGTGSVAGPLVVNTAGTIAPGASAGTFAAGATTLAGTYACEIDGVNKDTLAVTGDLNLTGSSLNITVLGAPTLPTYVIATYTGALTGTFGTVTGLPSGYSVAYQAGQIVITTAAGDAFSTWASANGISGAGGNVDSDGDGIRNGIEFVIGGDPSGPNSNSNSLLPTVSVDATYMTIVFRRSDESVSYNPHVQYGTGLGTWTDSVNGQPVATPVLITTENDAFGTGIDRVTVKVPRALAAPGTKLFGRLTVNIP